MNLLTSQRLADETSGMDSRGAETTGVPSPLTRRALGAALFDVVVIAPPGKHVQDAHRMGLLFRRAGYNVSLLDVPPDTDRRPDVSTLDDALISVCVVRERVPLHGRWLWWMLGRAEAVTQRQALVPISRKDPAIRVEEFRPRVPEQLAHLPYIGVSRAVGEADDSLWVVPAGDPPDSRRAANLEFWMHDAR